MPGWWKQFLKWRKSVAEQTGEQSFIDVTPEQEQKNMESKEEPRRGGWLSKWRAPKKREQQMATLQEGFNELVDLTRSIREHMDQQAQTQKTLLDMMNHIPGAVEGLKSVGKATEQQTETLALLKQQLEASARNEDHMVESMRSFNKTLALMDDMSKRTSQTVSSMADRTRDSEDLLRNILERSERRLVWMIVTLMVVTLSVIGAGLYIGLGARPSSVMIEPAESPAVLETFEHKKSITDLGDEPDADATAATVVPEEEGGGAIDPEGETIKDDPESEEMEEPVEEAVAEPVPEVAEDVEVEEAADTDAGADDADAAEPAEAEAVAESGDTSDVEPVDEEPESE